MAEQTRTQMTAAEFFELPESNSPIELLNGELVVSPTPIPVHQDAVGNTYTLLKQIAKTVGGKAYVAPLEIYFDDDNVPQPDVMWIAPANLHIIGEKRLESAPDLIVEVLSPSTAKNDKESKFRLYERYGVREYWVVDPVHQLVDVWLLTEGHFVWQGAYGVGDTFASPVLSGQTIDVTAIFNG
jgi:Uma2 family endonuclease